MEAQESCARLHPSLMGKMSAHDQESLQWRHELGASSSPSASPTAAAAAPAFEARHPIR